VSQNGSISFASSHDRDNKQEQQKNESNISAKASAEGLVYLLWSTSLTQNYVPCLFPVSIGFCQWERGFSVTGWDATRLDGAHETCPLIFRLGDVKRPEGIGACLKTAMKLINNKIDRHSIILAGLGF
jgi:hypothetical protein